mmetsp:Transcript_78068/g.201043  ORF Transcript_78068/g.201043 Transcript_78068/m.201043 type:complete len:287 (+) Transcript_78068:234-1094(+)
MSIQPPLHVEAKNTLRSEFRYQGPAGNPSQWAWLKRFAQRSTGVSPIGEKEASSRKARLKLLQGEREGGREAERGDQRPLLLSHVQRVIILRDVGLLLVLLFVRIHLRLELHQSEHRGEECAEEVRHHVAVLDLELVPDACAQEAQERGEADVDDQAQDAPLVELRGAEEQGDGRQVHNLEDPGPDGLHGPVAEAGKGPRAHVRRCPAHGKSGHRGVDQNALRIREGEDEVAEALPVEAQLTCLLLDQQHERLRAPEEDEGVRQATDHRHRLQRLQRPLAVGEVPP